MFKSYKPGFLDTPRNIIILLVIVAAVVGVTAYMAGYDLAQTPRIIINLGSQMAK